MLSILPFGGILGCLLPPFLPGLLKGSKAGLCLHQWSKPDPLTEPIHWMSYRSCLLCIFQVLPEYPDRYRCWSRNPVELSNSSAFTPGMAFLQARRSQGSCSASAPSWLSTASCTAPLTAANCITIKKWLLLCCWRFTCSFLLSQRKQIFPDTEAEWISDTPLIPERF